MQLLLKRRTVKMLLTYLQVFLVGGFICFLAQILIIKTNMTSSRILVLFLVIGIILEGLDLYDPIVEFGKAGATVPIVGFGRTLAKGVINQVTSSGILGVFSGGLASTATGIGAAVFFSFIFALIFNSHTKKS
ncbi:MAG: stage V sporulation protein AE [Clostridiales bacterium]|nr:stage V sporulation protein AE [Clostridiales bacterium]